MPAKRVVLPEAHRVTKRLASGEHVIYVYAYRGGPPIARYVGDTMEEAAKAEVAGTHALLEAYRTARAVPLRPTKTVRDLIAHYRREPDGLPKLARSTRAEWSRWLEKIDQEFGPLPLRLLEAKAARAKIKAWRNTMAHTPRSADYGVQVLKRLFAFGVEEGILAVNPAQGLRKLYDANRSDVVVSPAQLGAILSEATPSARQAIRLAAATGLRRGDLVRLRWTDVRADHLVIQTSKSQGRTTAVAPLIGDGLTVVQELTAARAARIALGEPASPFVLTTERGTPWLPASLTQAFIRAATAAGAQVRLHDLRGTAATNLLLAGLTPTQVAAMMGWEEQSVDRIMRRYVNPARIAQDAVERLAGTPARA